MQTYHVSRETFKKLNCFVEILKTWQDKMNLVSNNSLADVWTRHVADSLQLYQYLNNNVKLVCDIGSGSGFPAIVLAIVAKEENRPIQFNLIESITKKTVYLNDVKEKLDLKNIQIFNERSENLSFNSVDVITARAVANLDKLFKISLPLINKNTVLIFPKGKSFDEEIKFAQKNWKFNVTVQKNQVSDEGVILIISNLRKKK